MEERVSEQLGGEIKVAMKWEEGGGGGGTAGGRKKGLWRDRWRRRRWNGRTRKWVVVAGGRGERKGVV